MIPELGLYILITAVLASVLSLGAAGLHQQIIQLRALRLSSLLVVSALFLLAYSFYQVDLSVQIVYQHADHALPAWYRIGAVWGGHEGSMLLWVTILNLWILAGSFLQLPESMRRSTLSVLSAINLGFVCFILTVSNPFARYLPISPTSGQDLNPFLQDPVMLIHPPILYMGYLGLVLPFALAIAVLIKGEFSAEVMRVIRSCVLVAWSCLTFGIALGSFWAYYELGWGGWWFWDPVENASLLPWIASCALLHMLRVVQTRQGFQAWTLLLCLMGFTFSILGTFLVRSGALTSVHSFANDPKRGLFILCLLALYTLPALVLYSLRAGRLHHPIQFSLSSREGLILINNIIFMMMLATVLLGTLYPLAIESLGLGFISVGAPYFNALVIPMGLVLAAVLGFAPYSRWMKSFSWRSVWVKRLSLIILLIIALNMIVQYGLLNWPLMMSLGVLLVIWIVSQTLLSLRPRMGLRVWGMHLAHVGFAVLILGIAISTHYSVEDDVVLGEGQSHTMGQYEFTLDNLLTVQGPNYQSIQAILSVKDKGNFIGLMKPEKRFYNQGKMPIAQIALNSNLSRDLYVALAEPLKHDQWIVRIQVKPWIRLIWLGAIMMTLGGLMVLNKR
jgi:cytochrome c-type biogenesis protein CcmF